MYLHNLVSHRSCTAKVLAASAAAALLCFTSLPVRAIKNADNPSDDRTERVKLSSVALEFDSNKKWCTGTVLANRALLTAAHCFSGASGKVNIDGKAYEYYGWEVADIKIRGVYTDIALMRLKKDLPPTYLRLYGHLGVYIGVEPAAGYDDRTTMLIAGAGAPKAGTMQTATVQVVKTIADLQSANLHQIVLKGNYKNEPTFACQGDSGGGAWLQVDGAYRLVAVARAIEGPADNLCPARDGTAYTVINQPLKAILDQWAAASQ